MQIVRPLWVRRGGQHSRRAQRRHCLPTAKAERRAAGPAERRGIAVVAVGGTSSATDEKLGRGLLGEGDEVGDGRGRVVHLELKGSDAEAIGRVVGPPAVLNCLRQRLAFVEGGGGGPFLTPVVMVMVVMMVAVAVANSGRGRCYVSAAASGCRGR